MNHVKTLTWVMENTRMSQLGIEEFVSESKHYCRNYAKKTNVGLVMFGRKRAHLLRRLLWNIKLRKER